MSYVAWHLRVIDCVILGLSTVHKHKPALTDAGILFMACNVAGAGLVTVVVIWSLD